MKKVLKKMAVSLTAILMAVSSTYAALGSVSATNNEVQPRGVWSVYGDVNNDGRINIADAACIYQAFRTFEELTGDARLPLSYAIARPEVYFGTTYIVPQAADIDGDGYITEADEKCIQYYVARDYNNAGRCGEAFFIN